MRLNIDPKYAIEIVDHGQFENPGIQIVNPAGVAIPLDEPLILFRARDRHALPILLAYRDRCLQDGCTDYHLKGIDNRIEAFQRFREEHAERMKQPGVTEGK